MSTRLAMLEKLVFTQKTSDPFAWYGLGVEYGRLGRADDALRVFNELRQREPDYLPMYLMAAQLLLDGENPEAAREWAASGIELATRKSDSKARQELEGVLAQCD